MLILLLCIACNVVLAIIFKSFDRYQVDNLNAIIINYIVCVLFASVLLGESAIPLDLVSRPWWPYSFGLACLFIIGFNILGLSFQKSGVALTAIIQKMSLVIPTAVAIAIYDEPLGVLKAIGILVAMIAILLVNKPEVGQPAINWKSPLIIYPLVTFALSGVIEVILYYVEVEGFVGDDAAFFTASAFGQAAVLGSIFSLWKRVTAHSQLGIKEVLGGITLGLPNYLSIYLLVLLLSKGWDGSVLFPANSAGILVGASLTGFILYGEKIGRNKIIGIALGVLAIVLISMPVDG